MTEDKQHYIGIDLGTTNSVIGFGVIDPKTKQISPKVIELPMQDAQGGRSRRALLPSCVYFRENEEVPVVGEYAKAMADRQSQRVVRSIKSKMGLNETLSYDGRAYKPEDISSLILSVLASGAEPSLRFRPKQVVITVPASFDSDKRHATLLAAEKAGFDVRTEDGQWKDILLDEPRAALYDFINRQDRGEIAGSVIDFHDERRILVFDLGGGTLDVSLHRVVFNTDKDALEMEDLAISRYTRLGGDDFDRLLGEHLLAAMLRQTKTNFDELSPFRKEELTARFLGFAEEAKIELSNEVENRLSFNQDIDDVEVEILKGHVLDDRLFEYTLTLNEYRQIMRPLLGEQFSLADAERLENINEADCNNLIYPILDVIQKAVEKLGHSVPIDAVLLNGGMTKSVVVQERLAKLFGFQPISAGDPDKAVARGAVVHHYNMHRGIKIAKILNDTIGIGTTGGFVTHLIQAGTVLPYTSPVFSEFMVQKNGASYLDIPFYLGRGKTASAANRKIATRRIRFPYPLPEEEGISLQVSVDAAGLMVLKGWLTRDPAVTFTVEIATHETEPEPPSAKVDTLPVPAPRPMKHLLQPSPPTGPVEPVAELVNQLEGFLEQCKDNVFDQNSRLRANIKDVSERILRALNRDEFVPELIGLSERTHQTDAQGRLVLLLGSLAENLTEPSLRDAICARCMQLSDPRLLHLKPLYYHQIVVRYAIEAIGKCGSGARGAEGHLIDLLANPPVHTLRSSLLHSLGKAGEGTRALGQVRLHLNDPQDGVRIAANWAVGRLGMREHRNPIPAVYVLDVFAELLDNLGTETHVDALRNGVYALAEVGDQRYDDALTDRTLITKAKSWLTGFPESTPLKVSEKRHATVWKLSRTALQMMQGQQLSHEEEQVLLSIRSQLSTAVPFAVEAGAS